MSVIAKCIPQSNITIKKALNKGFYAQSTLPAARRFFQPRLVFSASVGVFTNQNLRWQNGW